LDDWISKALPASDRKQATIDLYATIARRHLVPILGGRRRDKVQPSDVEALIVTKRQEGLAQSTVRTMHTVLRSALDIAVRDGHLARNPAAAVRHLPSIGRTPATSRSSRPSGYSRRTARILVPIDAGYRTASR
jgi:integrase